MKDKITSWEEAVLWLKEQPDQAEFVRACFFDDPLIKAAQRYYESTEWQAVQSFLPQPPGKVLDIGAGRGITAYAFVKDGWNTVALEPDTSEVVGSGAITLLAKESGLEINVEESQAEEMPFESETFNIVHCRQVLHHADNLRRLCREASRVLKKGGMFIATREHVISKRRDLDKFLASHPLQRLYGKENAYLLKEYISAIENAGIKLEHVLNPFQSDINLFPDTIESFKTHLARKMMLPWPKLIPDIMLTVLGLFSRMPGRLYTFIGRKFSE